MEPNRKTVLKVIKLKPGITQVNYIAIIFHNFVMGLFLNGVELLQQDILADPNYYNLPADAALETNANITLFDLGIRIVSSIYFGGLVDKFGRKKILILGYIVKGIGTALLPIYGYSRYFDSVFPWYYMARFIYANGTTMIFLMPFVADYIEDQSKGKASGINAIFSAIGFLSSTTLIKTLYAHNMNLKYIFLIIAGIVFTLGMIYSFFVKGGNTYYRQQKQENSGPQGTGENDESRPSQSAPQKQITFKDVIKAIKQNPWIQASFLFALLNGAYLGIVSQVLNLFVLALGDSSQNIASEIVQFANVGGILATVSLGILLDFFPPFYIAVAVFVLSLGGYNFVWKISNANDPLLILLGVIAGISYSSALLFTYYLGSTYYPSHLRARLYGLSILYTCFGNLLITVVGGDLVRVSSHCMPFYFIIALVVLGSIAFILLYFKRIRQWENNRKKIHTERLFDTSASLR